MSNFFSAVDEAERYARSRPYFHPLAVARARETSGLEGRVDLALDVACGTGQSSRALTAVARRVIGLDVSPAMLAQARQEDGVTYVQAQAEGLPVRGGCAGLVSCALALHWFERERFLAETARVLHAGGLCWIYNNGFTGAMREEPAFHEWSHEVYPERFPTPPRDLRPFTAEDAAAAGLVWLAEERYENDVRLTPEGLAAYLMTQTNVAAALREGREEREAVRSWLLGEIRPYFIGAEGTFVFSTRAWYLRKDLP